ncbi:Dehydrodolichyl diphosphate syntase complex subunit [Nymphaea thermarum]|nr:Dehydrodolichyl diphosphate syntase complex subunit [Nymphaea thermarum]
MVANLHAPSLEDPSSPHGFMDRNRDLQDIVAMQLTSPFSGLQRSRTWRLMLGLCWFLLHLLVKLHHLAIRVARKLQCYLILVGYMFNCVRLGLNKLQCVAIVVDSEEAFQISKIFSLVRWLSKFGVKHISLYDMDGVLKESKKFLVKNWADLSPREWKEADKKFGSRHQKSVDLEWLSFSDGKEAVVRAALYICANYSKPVSADAPKPLTADAPQTKQTLTEADLDKALRAVGSCGPEPDLLFIFGPARCHLGFPAWRLRYTEIITQHGSGSHSID